MTTITINEDLGIGRNAFESLTELLSYLEENGLMVVLRELSVSEVTPEIQQKADDSMRRYREDPSSFADL